MRLPLNGVPFLWLVRLSGHSGAGKSRLTSALARRGIPRAVIYTSRLPRPGESHGIDYYFLSRGAIEALPGDQFLIRPVRNMLQAVDLMALQVDLQTNGLVLIEIFHDLWPELMDAMVQRIGSRLRTTSIFMTAVSPDELRNLPDDASRAEKIQSEVAQILRSRGKNTLSDIKTRSESAVSEILQAIRLNGAEQYSKILHSSPEGPDGVDDWTREGGPVGRAAAAIDEFMNLLSQREEN